MNATRWGRLIVILAGSLLMPVIGVRAQDAGEADKDGNGEGEADHDGDEEGIELHGHTREPAERVGGAERGEGRHEGAGQDAGASAEEQGVVEVLSGPVLFRF